MANAAITPITPALPGKDHLAWLQNSTILMSDGVKLFSYRHGIDKVWQPVIVESDILR
ncbi:MAG: hypothetical protein WDO71_22525 [Bacteroidota bacterium]